MPARVVRGRSRIPLYAPYPFTSRLELVLEGEHGLTLDAGMSSNDRGAAAALTATCPSSRGTEPLVGEQPRLVATSPSGAQLASADRNAPFDHPAIPGVSGHHFPD